MQCATLLGCLAKYAPSFGMMGTVVGLVLMLTNLDPDTLGPGMAVALITTFYGALIANLTFMPWSDKLKLINEGELQSMEITLKGVIAIQSGENPRVIKQKLLMYLPANKRPQESEDA
jgi:chemotaxis protein MotA